MLPRRPTRRSRQHRRVSRISAATGINRREVTRLTQRAPRRADAARPLAGQRAVRTLAYAAAVPRPRGASRGSCRARAPAPSFETLAQAITRDVHPRSLLDELLRLGLAELDPATDTVSLLRDAFVPRGDRVRMLGFLGDNVGDHLAPRWTTCSAERRRRTSSRRCSPTG